MLDRARQALADGVLCHGVIMYVEDPDPFVGALGALVRHEVDPVAWYGVRRSAGG